MPKIITVGDYVKQFSGASKERVDRMRSLLISLMPEAEERISYNIPAYFVNNKIVVYFAGYDDHIGVYPGRQE